MNPIAHIENFITIIDCGSITAAAEKQDITPAAASKRLQQLENNLGIRLLTRNTRQIAVTEAGEYYYRHQKQLLAEIERIDQHVQGMQKQLKGNLNINTPMTYGKMRLTVHLAEFLRKHPEIRISCKFDDAYVDVNSGEFDLVVRIGNLQDSELVARKLQDVRLMIVASPDYLKTHGHPSHPDQLRKHNCLHYTNMDQREYWLFSDSSGNSIRVKTRGNFASNNGETLKTAATQGLGIVGIPDFAIDGELERGELIELFPDFSTIPLSAYAVYPSRRYLPEKTRSLIDFLRKKLNPAKNPELTL